MRIIQEKEIIRFNNRFGGEDLVLLKGRKGSKYFTIEYAGVTLILDSTDMFDLIEMLKEAYKEVK